MCCTVRLSPDQYQLISTVSSIQDHTNHLIQSLRLDMDDIQLTSINTKSGGKKEQRLLTVVKESRYIQAYWLRHWLWQPVINYGNSMCKYSYNYFFFPYSIIDKMTCFPLQWDNWCRFAYFVVRNMYCTSAHEEFEVPFPQNHKLDWIVSLAFTTIL